MFFRTTSSAILLPILEIKCVFFLGRHPWTDGPLFDIFQLPGNSAGVCCFSDLLCATGTSVLRIQNRMTCVESWLLRNKSSMSQPLWSNSQLVNLPYFASHASRVTLSPRLWEVHAFHQSSPFFWGSSYPRLTWLHTSSGSTSWDHLKSKQMHA